MATREEGSKRWTPVWDGLWAYEHSERMGKAIYLFGLILGMARRGRAETSHRELEKRFKAPNRRMLERWLERLRREGYIKTSGRDPLVIEINKWRPINSKAMTLESGNDGSPSLTSVSYSFTPTILSRGKTRRLPSKMAAHLPKMSGRTPKMSGCGEIISLKSGAFATPKTFLKYLKIKSPESGIPAVSNSGNSGKSKSPKSKARESKYKFSAIDLELAELIRDKILELNPKHKTPDSLESWAHDVRLMRERDRRTSEEIRALFLWANAHQFWQSNILSPGKLRAKFDQLAIQMQSARPVRKRPADLNAGGQQRVVI